MTGESESTELGIKQEDVLLSSFEHAADTKKLTLPMGIDVMLRVGTIMDFDGKDIALPEIGLCEEYIKAVEYGTRPDIEATFETPPNLQMARQEYPELLLR